MSTQTFLIRIIEASIFATAMTILLVAIIFGLNRNIEPRTQMTGIGSGVYARRIQN